MTIYCRMFPYPPCCPRPYPNRPREEKSLKNRTWQASEWMKTAVPRFRDAELHFAAAAKTITHRRQRQRNNSTTSAAAAFVRHPSFLTYTSSLSHSVLPYLSLFQSESLFRRQRRIPQSARKSHCITLEAIVALVIRPRTSTSSSASLAASIIVLELLPGRYTSGGPRGEGGAYAG